MTLNHSAKSTGSTFINEPSNENLVNEYLDYMSEYNYNLENVSKKEVPHFAVRIPVINPRFKMAHDAFNMQIYMYLKSKKPQEWWQMKGTSVLIQLDV